MTSPPKSSDLPIDQGTKVISRSTSPEGRPQRLVSRKKNSRRYDAVFNSNARLQAAEIILEKLQKDFDTMETSNKVPSDPSEELPESVRQEQLQLANLGIKVSQQALEVVRLGRIHQNLMLEANLIPQMHSQGTKRTFGLDAMYMGYLLPRALKADRKENSTADFVEKSVKDGTD